MDRHARQLTFVNSDAKPKVTDIWVARESIPLVMAWYGSYCAGDRYQVLCDGLPVKKDHNGEIVGEIPE